MTYTFPALSADGTLTATFAAANQAPVIDSFLPASDPTVAEGSSQAFSITCHDPDGTTPTVSWLLDGNTVGSGLSYTYNPDYSSSGPHTVTATASDGSLNAQHQWAVTVTNVVLQVTYVSAGTASANEGSGTNDPYPAYPTGLQLNDLILLQVAVRDTSTTPATPSGFTLLFGPDSADNTGRQWIYYKFSTGTESGTVTVSVSGSTMTMARMYAFRNVALSNFVEINNPNPGSGNGATISARPVTTIGDKRLCVSLVYVTNNNNVGSFTGETGGDWTEAVTEYQFNGNDDGCIQLQTATMATAGTVTGGGYTMSGSDDWGLRAFALIPR
jgi:hypothetical protein